MAINGLGHADHEFFRACKNASRPHEIEDHLNEGASVYVKDLDGNTALHMAAANRDVPEACTMLIEAGAGIDAVNNDGLTPLMEACANNRRDAFQLLVEAGANVHHEAKYERTALHFACGDEHITKALLDRGLNPNAKTDEGETPLMIASQVGNVSVCATLLSSGADHSLGDDDGWTALHHAAHVGYPKCVVHLVEHGALVNARSEDGDTPLHLAQHDAVEVLVDLGADLRATNNAGLTPIEAIDDNDFWSNAKREKLQELMAYQDAKQLDAMTVEAAGSWSPSSADAEALMPAAMHAEHAAATQQRSRRL